MRRSSARQLASSIAEGTIRAREAVEAYIARIEQVNGALNAVVVRRYDEARAEANAVDFDVVERTAFETDRASAGLPVGVQLMGRPWRDDVVLAAMREIEQAARKRADFPLAPNL